SPAAAEDEALPSSPPIAPFMVSEPIDQTVPAGTDVLFTVTADGTPPLTYQWKKDGLPLGGQTSPSLTLNEVSPTDAGNYSVVISNEIGSVTSRTKTLTVVTEAFSRVFW